jgi:N4-gp56 family major capsid protein
MPEPANSYAKLPSQRKTYYERVLLDRLLEELVFTKFAQTEKSSIPKHEGDTINFRRFNSLPVPTDSLVEGITPAGADLSITQITATVKEEGNFVPLTNWLDLVGIDPVIQETSELCGENAGETIETRIRDIIFNGTNVYYASGGIARNTVGDAHTFTGTIVRRAKQIMTRNRVKPVPGMGAYIGVIHPDGAYDLKGHTEWREPNTYVDVKNIINGEIGKLYGIRWIESNYCPVWDGEGLAGDTVYGGLVIGRGAYGAVDIAGSAKPEIIVKQKGSAGTGDPLNQRSSIGWYAAMTAVRLNELCLLRVEHGSSM